MNLGQARKALVAVLGVLGQVIALGILHGTALHDVQVVVAALTAVSVYLVPNAAAPAPTSQPPAV